jgi:hypothetical protein
MTRAWNGAATVAPARAKRSGTRLSNAERAETCERTEMLTVRLRAGYRDRLKALAAEDGYSVAEWVESRVEMAETELAEFRQRPPRRAVK